MFGVGGGGVRERGRGKRLHRGGVGSVEALTVGLVMG